MAARAFPATRRPPRIVTSNHDNSTLVAHAAAKLNLALSVGPRAADGRHPICSWMVTVDLFDDLTVTRLPGDRLSRYAILWHEQAKRRSDIDWSVTRDLAVRAHLAIERHVGRALPVQMKLEKRIPVGGGLGGGSADAAAMLHAVNELFDLGLPLERLSRIGAELGSDVPFLVSGGSAVVEGTGERVQPHPSAGPLHAVVAFPDVRCDTADVYRLFDELPPREMRSDRVRALAAAPPRADELFNDLMEAAIAAAPRLEHDLRRLGELAERPARLSGSGSSIFVLCDDALHSRALAEATEERLDLPAVAIHGHPSAATAGP
jgi:4-diphosphocytidyl-2-C-methyl-D-erythritol kinase